MPPRAPPAVCNWPNCGREYATKRDLQRHQLSHNAPQFSCNSPGCERKFFRRDALLRHQRNRTCTRRLSSKSQVPEGGEDYELPMPLAAPSDAYTLDASRRVQRNDSLESSSSSSNGVAPPMYAPPPGPPAGFEDEFEDDDVDYFDPHRQMNAAATAATHAHAHAHYPGTSPISSSAIYAAAGGGGTPTANRRYSGPYDPTPTYYAPAYPQTPSQPRSPVSSRTSYYGYPPAVPFANTPPSSYYEQPSSFPYGTVAYSNTSNARGSTGSDEHDEPY